MSWMGKVIGLFLGAIFLPAPFGVFIGLFLGHLYDKSRLHRRIFRSGAGSGSTEVQRIFFNATFAVLGYLAKSDGHVTQNEIRVAESVMRRFSLNDEMKREAIAQFNHGKQPGFDYIEAVNELKRVCWLKPSLLRVFLELQIQIAYADGRLSPGTRSALKKIFAALGITGMSFDQFERQYQTGQNYQRHSQGPDRDPRKQLHDAYELLGVSKDVSDNELKRAYRRKMSKHHPDRLIAQGVPEEMIKVATQKTQQIKSAYETVKQVRGLT